MAFEPFDIDLIIERLKAEVPELDLVEGAAEYANITKIQDFRTPSAYVLLARETPGGDVPNPGNQKVIVHFGVVIAARNYRDRRGGETGNKINPIVGAVRKALVGYKPAVRGGRPIKWIQGDTLDFNAGTLLWSDVFETQHFIGE